MTHPMQPTPEQLAEWLAEACKLYPNGKPGAIAGHVAGLAYASGADAELEACCEYLHGERVPGYAAQMFVARRPKLTPKQRALNACAAALAAGRLTPDEAGLIRCVVEATR